MRLTLLIMFILSILTPEIKAATFHRLPGQLKQIQTCTGATYYVSNNGSDAADGLTPGTAWKTISKVNSSSFLSPGDCVLFNRGHTWNEQLVIPSSGNIAGGYITFGVYGSGAKPLLDGSGVSLAKHAGLIQSSGKSYIIIDGLRVQDVGYVIPGGDSAAGNENHGINFAIGTSHGIIRNCEVSNTEAAGIRAHGSKNIVIAANEVEMACVRSKSESISISGRSHDIEVMYNKVHNNGATGPGYGGSGIDMKGGSYNGKIHHNEIYNLHSVNGIYADAWNKLTTNIEIYNNYVHDFTDGGTGIQTSSEQGGTLDNVLVHHNIIENIRTGLMIHPGRAGKADPIQNIYVYNNTVVNCGPASPASEGGYFIRNPDASNVNIKNNIFSQNVGYQVGFSTTSMTIPDRAGYNIENNVMHGTINTPNVSSVDGVAGNNAILSDPLFISASDFHLQNGSPAENTGKASVWQGIPNITDYDGKAITDENGNIVTPDGTVNCGAYE
ncbi:right-handed parallel beta-helix repeat-containing protein [Desulfogranum marinum]|uniref:right-handed parallel beta-helix repeat-containing protein n=1 Tax=Desulfogranum marinum TaxID=453220 RepID=UPI001964FADE|nr:right-handed parallel beta-helix repeat-containing protein [Desulfogranum marinum]MBM9513111.1 right-handed parallel beta-helix repeat-containing protein [Desulfogranum marinum]